MKKIIRSILASLLAAMCGVAGAAAANPREGARSVDCITYEDYGAVGDGVTDDFGAIIRAHEAANAAGLPVRADPGATYYLGGGRRMAEIQTDTDWSGAQFIIDDTKVAEADYGWAVFRVSSKLAPVPVTGVTALRKNQAKLALNLDMPHGAVIIATDNTTMRFIREGANQNNGTAQTDVIVVDKDGNVDMRAPIVWDYDNITSIIAYPMDEGTLTVRGGHFTTIANQPTTDSPPYCSRNIRITRSNVVIDGVVHDVTGETDKGAPYNGFVVAWECANVTVQNCQFSGHRIYKYIGSAGTLVERGTYDINASSVANLTYKNCTQRNDMLDENLWGIMCSCFCKNLEFDGCALSRFDAHMGTAGATIRNSVLRTITVTGFGLLLVENTKKIDNIFISLRPDYGSFWDGDVVIRNCEFVTSGKTPSLLYAENAGQHDFGYPCMMPRKITIDGLVIDDRSHPAFYLGPYIFDKSPAKFPLCGDTSPYPYAKTQEVSIKNLTVKSGRWLIRDTHWYTFSLLSVKIRHA